MPESSPTDAGSLSARAQEILRRADVQMAALRTPSPAPDSASPPVPASPPPSPEARPLGSEDLGQLLDTVEAGIGAARAHLVALSASLERIAQELGVGAPPLPDAPPAVLPPQLKSHTTLPSELAAPKAPEPESESEPAAAAEQPAPPARDPSAAAHGAARLVAIEMAVAGDTREGVGRRLRQEFGIRDPSGILDDAFGPDPGSSGRRSYGV